MASRYGHVLPVEHDGDHTLVLADGTARTRNSTANPAIQTAHLPELDRRAQLTPEEHQAAGGNFSVANRTPLL